MNMNIDMRETNETRLKAEQRKEPMDKAHPNHGSFRTEKPSAPSTLQPALQKMAACIMPPPSVPGLTSGGSSQRDTMTNMMHSGLGSSQDLDPYLMRLLGKGVAKPPLPPAVGSSGFRVPDPVPRGNNSAQATTTTNPAAAAATGTATVQAPAGAIPKGSPAKPSSGAINNNKVGPTTATASGQPVTGGSAEATATPEWSYSDTQKLMGPGRAAELRASVVSHQVAFLEQLYDLHRAIAVQKLLVRNCPEIQPLLADAAHMFLSSACSLQDPAAPGPLEQLAPAAKRARIDAAGGSCDAAEPGLHPDSQFAAVPLPGETEAGTEGGSGDDADGSGPNGSGGNGSGGGSTSPQPQVAFPPLSVPHVHRVAAHRVARMRPLQAAPSGASQTPMAFPRHSPTMQPWGGPMGQQGFFMAPPMEFPGMPGGSTAPGAGLQVGNGAANAGSGSGAMPVGGMPNAMYPGMNFPGMGGGMPGAADPMAWWYQNYYGRPQMPPQMQQHMAQQQGQGQSHGQPNVANVAAAAAAAAMPAFAAGGMPPPPQRWWLDPNATFGPPADPQVAAMRGLREREAATGAGEVESLPSAAAAVKATTATAGGRGGGDVHKPLSRAGLASRRSKRKPSDPIEEASSGTTGQDHHLGHHAVTDDAHYAARKSARGAATTAGAAAAAAAVAAMPLGPGAADTSAAKLLLSFSNKNVQ